MSVEVTERKCVLGVCASHISRALLLFFFKMENKHSNWVTSMVKQVFIFYFALYEQLLEFFF